MLFNSFTFIFLFLPLTFALWRLLCHFKKTAAALYWLLLASLIFYGYWNPPYIALLALSIVINYFFQRTVAACPMSRRGKQLLTVGVTLNLLCIGYFKYADFFMRNVSFLLHGTWEPLNIFLPLGISFFTFQEIACLVDTYHGKIGRIPFHRYALFVTFFPQLIAGPIVLADKLIPQFDDKRIFVLSWSNIYVGLVLFSIGLFKKVIIADSLSPWVAEVFDAAQTLSCAQAWGGALAYTFQLYFDFSDYSDMAIGLGRLFNIELPMNFNSPYKATSIIDFWRRWHMTLSMFLRNYVYIPLGGNRKGTVRKDINLLTTMLLCGLWHGAGWPYIIWGGMHGCCLIVNNLWRKYSPIKLNFVIGWFFTFFVVVVSRVFFRSDSFSRAIAILKSMARVNELASLDISFTAQGLKALLIELGVRRDIIAMSWTVKESMGAMLIIALLLCVAMPNAAQTAGSLRTLSGRKLAVFSLAVGLLITYTFLYLNTVSEFLYFQF